MSRISVSDETWSKIQACKVLLREAYSVDFTAGEVVSYLWSTIGTRIPDEMYVASHGVLLERARRHGFSLDRDIAIEIRALGKRVGVPIQDIVHTVVGAFVRAGTSEERQGGLARIPIRVDKDGRRLVIAQSGRVRRKPRVTDEVFEMQRWKYKEAFEKKISPYLDLKKIGESTLYVHIHTFPLEELPFDDDPALPAEKNPAAVYHVRILPRGRGYQVFILRHCFDVGPSVSHPKTSATVGPPTIAPGTTFRLFDIYRNINWTNVELERE